MNRNNYTAHSSFAPARRYFCTRMVTYRLYAPILRAKMPCSEPKYKSVEQLFRAI